MINYMNHYPVIGQSWTGKHVILLHCTMTNYLEDLYKSNHAPMETVSQNCAETLSQLLSIGYHIYAVTAISPNQIQYLLIQ